MKIQVIGRESCEKTQDFMMYLSMQNALYEFINLDTLHYQDLSEYIVKLPQNQRKFPQVLIENRRITQYDELRQFFTNGAEASQRVYHNHLSEERWGDSDSGSYLESRPNSSK